MDNKYGKLALDAADQGNWDSAIKLLRYAPKGHNYDAQVAQMGIPREHLHHFLNTIKQYHKGDMPNTVFELAHNIPDDYDMPELNQILEHSSGDGMISHIVKNHKNYDLNKDPEALGAHKASEFWHSYETSVRPEHFAAIHKLMTGEDKEIETHRGKSDLPNAQVIAGSVYHGREDFKPQAGKTLHFMMHEAIPHLQAHAKKTQDAIMADQEIPKRNFGGKPHVFLYRGVGGSYGHKIHEGLGFDGREIKDTKVNLPVASLSSFSTDKGMAKRFAAARGEHDGVQGKGAVFGTWVPLEHILHSGFHTVHPGQEHAHENESEIVVGHPKSPIKVPSKNFELQVPHPTDAQFIKPAVKPKPDKLGKSEDLLEKGAARRVAPFNPSEDISVRHRNKLQNWVESGLERGSVPLLTGPARTRGILKLSRNAMSRKNPETGEREFLLFRGKTGHDIKNNDKFSGLSSFTPDPSQAENFNNTFINAGSPRALMEWYPPEHEMHQSASKMLHENRNPETFDADRAHHWNLREKYFGGIYTSWVPESAIHHIPNAVGEKDSGNKSPNKMGPSQFANEQEVIVNTEHPGFKPVKLNPEHTNTLKDMYSDHIQGVINAQSRRAPVRKSEDLKKAKLNLQTGKLEPEPIDPEGMPHPDFPHYVKGRSVKTGKKPVWKYRADIADSFDKDAANALPKLKEAMPEHANTIDKMYSSVAKDGDRHVVDSGTYEPEVRMRHLSWALQGKPGYSLKPTQGGFQLTAERHSKGSPTVLHTWNFDGNKFKFSHSSPISDSSRGDSNAKPKNSFMVKPYGKSENRSGSISSQVPRRQPRDGSGVHGTDSGKTRSLGKSAAGGVGRLSKGQAGDWQKEGYTLHHSVGLDDLAIGGTKQTRITAKTPKGETAGYVDIETHQSGNHIIGMSVVKPEHQRKGLATGMYQLAEQKLGGKLYHSELQSPDAEKLWAQPNRPFGKADLIPGGLAQGKTNKDFPAKKIKQGEKVEMEHTSSKKIAQEVARDHLVEDKNYYTKLARMEKGQKGDWQKEGYIISHDPYPTDNGGIGIRVHAKKGGKEVGFANIGYHDWNNSEDENGVPIWSPKPTDHIMSYDTEVHPDHQRKGIASAMYKYAEKHFNAPIEMGSTSPDADKLWSGGRNFGKSSLQKGLKGDWKTEGYTFTHDQDGKGWHTVSARTPKGEVAGIFNFTDNKKLGTLKPQWANVGEEHQRKGLASEAYRLVQKNTGLKLLPSDIQTEAGKQLWSKNHSLTKSKKEDMGQVASVAVMHGGKILMGKRTDDLSWTLPGGHMDKGETPEAGALRELFEEAGVKPNDIHYLGNETITTKKGEKKKIHAFVCFGKYRTSVENDPDEECKGWNWIDCSNGSLPKHIRENLHSPKNVVLKKLGLLKD